MDGEGVDAVDVELAVVNTDERALFWAYVGEEPDPRYRLLTPQLWVSRSRLFRELPRDLDPAALARLAARRADYPRWPTLEKCVGEAVFEQARRILLPPAPSRLSCLFAALDAESAASFAIEWMPPDFDHHGRGDVATLRVRTGGARWVALDMHLFYVPREIGESAEANEHALRRTWKRAARYWRGETSSEPFVEVLATSLERRAH
jgi:hypothetical protein